MRPMIGKIAGFIKIEHTAFSLPLLFTGAWMGAGLAWPGTVALLLIVLAATGARIFGMSLNRIADRRIDALNPRTALRELPSGVLDIKTARTVALAGLAAYLGACAALGSWCLLLSPLPLIPLSGYSFLKRFTVLCHFGIGLCLALAPLGAFVAVSGHPRFSGPVLLFALFVFFWLSGADIIYALMDIDSDRGNGVFSLPARIGAGKAQAVAAGLHLAAFLCLMAILMVGRAGGSAEFFLLITIGFFIAMHLPVFSISKRFFPISTLAGVAGALTSLFITTQ